MRRSAYWKAGESELICLHGGLRFPYIGRMAKNFRADLDFLNCKTRFPSKRERRKTLEQDLDVFNYEICLSLHFICLSFPASQNNRKSADKLSDG